MTKRIKIRTVVTLAAALCVVTMFSGAVAAQSLGPVDAGLEDVTAGSSGGGGIGAVDISTDQGGANGEGIVEADAEDQTLRVAVSGEGGPAGNQIGGGVDCTFQAAPENPCEVDSPAGNGLPSLPPENAPSIPPENAPSIPPENAPNPGDLLPL